MQEINAVKYFKHLKFELLHLVLALIKIWIVIRINISWCLLLGISSFTVVNREIDSNIKYFTKSSNCSHFVTNHGVTQTF